VKTHTAAALNEHHREAGALSATEATAKPPLL